MPREMPVPAGTVPVISSAGPSGRLIRFGTVTFAPLFPDVIVLANVFPAAARSAVVYGFVPLLTCTETWGAIGSVEGEMSRNAWKTKAESWALPAAVR